MTTVPVIVRDRFYVPKDYVRHARVRELYSVKFETKKLCRTQCPFARKPGRFCSTCPGKDNKIKMYEVIRTKGGKTLVALPAGNLELLRKVVKGKIRLIDKRPIIKFKSDLRWKGKLRRKGDVDSKGNSLADQRGMVAAWKRHVESGETGGMICSPPRTGKCVAGDTLIRTSQGWTRIDTLFAGLSLDINTIGRFGIVSTPLGFRDIRGLYSHVVDSTIEVLLESGQRLVGSENQRVLTLEGAFPRWTRIADLKGGEEVASQVNGSFSRSDGGVSRDYACVSALLASSITDQKSGLANIVFTGRRDDKILADALYRVTRVRVNSTGNAIVDKSNLPANWGASETWWFPESLATAHDDSLLTFIRTLFYTTDNVVLADDQRVTHVASNLPTRIARIIHVVANAFGLDVTLLHDFRSSSLVATINSARLAAKAPWSLATVLGAIEKNKVPITLPGTGKKVDVTTSSVLVVKRVNEAKRLYDVMVPDVKCFAANGVIAHNTVMGVASSLAFKERTFITASEINWLRQFGKRFKENSNVKELYKRGQYPVVLVDPKGWPDGPDYGIKVVKRWSKEVAKADVVLSSYQQFIHPERGKAKQKQFVDGKFSTVIVDECVTGNTPIVIDYDGTTLSAKEIYNSKVDEVVARDKSGNPVKRRILRKMRRNAIELIRIKHDGGSVWCTSNHPIWVASRQEWVLAKDLQPGDELNAFTPRDG